MKHAIVRYNQLESKLMKYHDLHAEYDECIRKFLELDHVEDVPKLEIYSRQNHYEGPSCIQCFQKNIN